MDSSTIPDTSDSPIQIAVVGAGFGRFHVRGLLRNPDIFDLRVLCDQDVQRAEGTAKSCGLPADRRIVNDYRAVLDDDGIQAVVLSLPHHLHEQACVEAATAGKHILVDKPIARTCAEADRIIRPADENGVTLMVAFNYRFIPIYRKMHDVVKAGGIGAPLFAVTRHYQNFHPPPKANWRSKESVGGGCVIGSGVHNIDVMRWFFGEPDEVFAHAAFDPQRLEAESAAAISFKYAQGPVVNFSCNWTCSGAVDGWDEWGEWEVFGSGGDIAIRKGALQVGHEFGGRIEQVTHEPNAYEDLWQHFANAIMTGTPPMTNGRDARASLGLVLDVYESIETGQPVRCGKRG